MTAQDRSLQAQALAKRHLPLLLLDTAEPYLPVAIGYSVFTGPGQSPSSKFAVEPAGQVTIEYAVFYDWDIGHLYDLEHVWVHLDAKGAVIAVEASAHGRRETMDSGDGLPELREGRPVLYPEAGKHAHWAHPRQMPPAARERLAVLCGPLAGHEGVHLGNSFAEAGAYRASARDHRLARRKMAADAFVPSHRYELADIEPQLMAWPDLAAFIPRRVTQLMAALPGSVPHFGAIFIDCGDTLIDERSEEKLPGSEVVIRADLIPGARQMMDDLRAAGHKLILVADGPRQTFVNMLTHHGLWDHFDAHIISEDIGCHKPDARMFDAALKAAGLTRADAWRTAMIGNNLSRDINGANALGITSVFMAWSTLRSHVPADASETPDYRIGSPAEFVGLLDRLEALLCYRMAVPNVNSLLTNQVP